MTSTALPPGPSTAPDTARGTVLATGLPPAIGLNGFARSGKDTAGQALTGLGYVRVAFATPIYQAMVAIDPYLRNPDGRAVRLTDVLAGYAGDWDRVKADPVYGPQIRQLAQRIGTDFGRIILGESTWIDYVASKVALAHDTGSPVVLTDVRFPDEAEWVRAQGWPVVRIHRPGVGPANGHSSEVSLPEHLVDHQIANDGTIETLHARVTALVSALSQKTVA